MVVSLHARWRIYESLEIFETESRNNTWFIFFKKRKKMGFTPYKAEQPLQGMELQEKGAKKD